MEQKYLDAAIVATASDEFFPWLMNWIGSIQTNYPNHPPLFVYELGLRSAFLKELRAVSGIHVIRVPPFVPHWRTCYTWKFYALVHAPARLVCWLDPGSEVQKPLDEIFHLIEKDGYFCVRADSNSYLADIVPPDLLSRVGLPHDFCGDRNYFSGALFGFKRGTIYEGYMVEAFELAKEGWTLGLSPSESRRNIGLLRSAVVRNCRIFRHDQTLLNVLMYKHVKDLVLQDHEKFPTDIKNKKPEQPIWHSRRSNGRLKYWKRGVQYEGATWRFWRSLNRGYCFIRFIATRDRILRVATRVLVSLWHGQNPQNTSI